MKQEKNSGEYLDGGYSECVKGPLKAQLCQGLDALGLRPTASQVSKLSRYLELLEKWNKVYNLTAIRDINEMLVQHVFDCLAIIKPLQKQCSSSVVHVLDVGSGAGLPAAIIAAMCPDWQVTAIDAVHKKMAFVQQLTGSLALPNLAALHARVENLENKSYNLIISRAFSSLTDFVSLTQNSLAEDGVWCAMKGKEPVDEMEKIQGKVNVFHVEQLSVPCMSAQRCLVWMRPNQ